MNRKQPSPARKALRSLGERDLAGVNGGILIHGSTSLGGPDTAGTISNPAAGAIIFWRPTNSGG